MVQDKNPSTFVFHRCPSPGLHPLLSSWSASHSPHLSNSQHPCLSLQSFFLHSPHHSSFHFHISPSPLPANLSLLRVRLLPSPSRLCHEGEALGTLERVPALSILVPSTGERQRKPCSAKQLNMLRPTVTCTVWSDRNCAGLEQAHPRQNPYKDSAAKLTAFYRACAPCNFKDKHGQIW